MPKVRILDPSMAGYSDYLVGVEFKDGVSVDSLTQFQAQALAGIFRIETIDGEDPSESASYIALVNGEDQPVNYDIEKSEEPEVVYDYTEESLQDIADKKGIEGLRVIASQYNIKGKSIVSLIDGLMVLKNKGFPLAD